MELSKVEKETLAAIKKNPGNWYDFIYELENFDFEQGAVANAVANLETLGLITVTTNGELTLYSAPQKSEI